jgi:hypothetical protein
MRAIEISDLSEGGRYIHDVRIASHAEGDVLAALVSTEDATLSVWWLRLPEGKECRRRDIPIFEHAPPAALSADTSMLAYLAYARDGFQLVVERLAGSRSEVRRIRSGIWCGLAFACTFYVPLTVRRPG